MLAAQPIAFEPVAGDGGADARYLVRGPGLVNGARHEVAVRYSVHAGTIGFTLGAYDRSEPLVIDPVLVYSSLVGGSDSSTNGLGLAFDAKWQSHICLRSAGNAEVRRGPQRNSVFCADSAQR